MTPLRGTKAWFGPRTMGWGWEPVSWEGWVVSVTAIVLMLAPIAWAAQRGREDLWILPWTLGVAAVLVVICRAKGTSPGGPKLKKKFDRERRKEQP